MLALILAAHAVAGAPPGPVVHTTCGPVLGAASDASGIGAAFRAIPYAVPPTPVHGMRFRRSKLLSEGEGTCWPGTLNASGGWGSMCMQNSWAGSGGHEDCLFLNVWTPQLPSSLADSEGAASVELLPVFFYIHGGSLVGGDGNTEFAGLAGQQMVVVTINYRLNVPGFLALEALTATDAKNASGNYGLSDQVTALRWVKQNIEKFGGDPARVTIAGQSSGGTSVWNLLAIPSAKGLFSAALPMSGASRNNVTLREASRDNAIFLELTHCANAGGNALATRACIDALSEKAMAKAFDKMCALKGTMCACGAFDFHMPVPTEYQSGVAIIDGVVVPQDMQRALAVAAAHTHVPVLAGSMAQEASGTPEALNDPERFRGQLEEWGAALGLSRATIANASRLYAADQTDEFRHDWSIAYDSIISDIRVVCGCLANVARLVSSCGDGTAGAAAACPVWQYYTDMSGVRNTSTNEAHHGYDLEQLTTDPTDPEAFKSAAERQYFERAVELFATFVRTHAPPPAAGFKRFGDVPGGGAGKIGVVGELPREYNLNNLDQVWRAGGNAVAEDRLQARCATWADAVVPGQHGRSVLQSFAWVE